MVQTICDVAMIHSPSGESFEMVAPGIFDVFADLLVHPDGAEFAVVVSQADEPRDVRLTTPRGSRDLSLAPRGATVVPLPTPTPQR